MNNFETVNEVIENGTGLTEKLEKAITKTQETLIKLNKEKKSNELKSLVDSNVKFIRALLQCIRLQASEQLESVCNIAVVCRVQLEESDLNDKEEVKEKVTQIKGVQSSIKVLLDLCEKIEKQLEMIEKSVDCIQQESQEDYLTPEKREMLEQYKMRS